MSTDTEYIIPKGIPSARKIQNFGSSEPPKDTKENSTHPPPPAPVVSAPKKQPSEPELNPWELLDHIKKPVAHVPSKATHTEKTDTTPAEPTPVVAKKATERPKKPILKILKSNEDSTTNQNTAPRKTASIEIPQPVLTLLKKDESDKKNLALFKTFIEDLPNICPGRITLSTQDDTICVWNYDEGVPFSFFRIVDERLYCGVESSLVPQEESKITWVPPTWLFPESVSFFQVTETTPMIFNRIEQASLAATLTVTKMAL